MRGDGEVLEMAAKIFGEELDGGIATLRLFAERFEKGVVEVALEVPLQLLGRGGLGRSSGARDDGARTLRLIFQNGAGQFVGGRGLEAVGTMSGEQFVEDDAERIDVAGGGDRLAADL